MTNAVKSFRRVPAGVRFRYASTDHIKLKKAVLLDEILFNAVRKRYDGFSQKHTYELCFISPERIVSYKVE